MLLNDMQIDKLKLQVSGSWPSDFPNFCNVNLHIVGYHGCTRIEFRASIVLVCCAIRFDLCRQIGIEL